MADQSWTQLHLGQAGRRVNLLLVKTSKEVVGAENPDTAAAAGPVAAESAAAAPSPLAAFVAIALLATVVLAVVGSAPAPTDLDALAACSVLATTQSFEE